MAAGDRNTPHRQSLFRKISTAPKVHSPYEDMMRKFTEKRQIKCSSVPVDLPRETRPLKHFMTGSKYQGSWDILGMAGPNAIYTFPNGVTFKGEFEDGLRHGLGEMHYPTGEIMKGKFRCGRMVERTLFFADGLEYADSDWMYCKMPDRRFTLEYETGVMPSGKSYMTADLPTRQIPPEHYDTGDGFYDPTTKAVFKPDGVTSLIRAPTAREQKWILANCRYAADEALGPRPHLYEEWLEPEVELDSPPLPAALSLATAWMFESNRALNTYDSEESMISIEGGGKWRRDRPSFKAAKIEELRGTAEEANVEDSEFSQYPKIVPRSTRKKRSNVCYTI